jgi:hypothetical protein
MAKVLFVVTATRCWTLKDGTRHPTGYWAEEFAAPYSVFSQAGHRVAVGTPGGTAPYVDVMTLRPSMAGSAEIAERLEEVLRSAEQLRRPIQLANVRLDDYDAVYYPGWPRSDGRPMAGRRFGSIAHRGPRIGQAVGDCLSRTGRCDQQVTFQCGITGGTGFENHVVAGSD